MSLRTSLQRLARRDPTAPSLRERLASATVRLSDTKERAGRAAKAAKILMKAPEPAPEPPNRVALINYSTWLWHERRRVCSELHPHLGTRADAFVMGLNAAEDWHYDGRDRSGGWAEKPPATPRAIQILDLVGVNWRADVERGLSHLDTKDYQDSGERPKLPHGWPAPDAVLVEALDDLTRLPDAIGLELDRLHGIAVAEFKRRNGPEKSEAEQSALRRELHLDELNYVPPRENGEVPKPGIDTLSAQILALWPAWAAYTGDDGTDEQTAAYEAMQQRRFTLLHAADALPATLGSIQPKALALAWLHYVNEWRQGQKRDDYSTDGRLAIDIHMAALTQPGQTPPTVVRQEPDLVGMLDLTSASMEDLRAVHDVADLVGSVAYATTWQGRCKMRGYGDEANAAGKLMQWLGDALTDVETATSAEAARRVPGNSSERGRRLSIWAASVIDNDDPKSIEAFARELLAHAEAERAGR
ncbi:hypothetical protein MKL09_05140 [Methylobacterium sp. J-048]|uniref:hypothetical protein n=1 Tax=Methylobacterium sp. J-048 TaxID=2836635 RepID=UPI001FBA9FBD|nr:hypothetical protein [Methylobacterium sp. J-048]MCJ2055934.1 hypothetical protein [Methylobacterium sp. J-048]